MREIVFATHNRHKAEEVKSILGEGWKILTLSDIGCHEDIPETADTLAGNALIKARWVRDRYGKDCFADDTGLMVDALGGAPGVKSARYAGESCDSEANIEKLLRELDGKRDRGAHFATVVALCLDGEEKLFEGRVDGHISESRHGTGGFGYDPVFIESGSGVSFADMSAEDKNAVSHRGRAIRSLAAYLCSK